MNFGIGKIQLVEKSGLKPNEVKNAMDELIKKIVIEYRRTNKKDGGYYIK